MAEKYFDWPEIYAALAPTPAVTRKKAIASARQIMFDIDRRGWIPGTMVGSQKDLKDRCNIGRDTLREAVRLLEDRGAAWMRRGPSGGLISLPSCEQTAVENVSRFLAHALPTPDDICEAWAVLGCLCRYSAAAVSRGALPLPKTVRLQGASRTDCLTSPDMFVHFFSRCLAELDPDPAQPIASLDDDQSKRPMPRAKAPLVRAAILMLVRDIERSRRLGLSRVGTEDELRDRYNVSRQVLRQAIRVLESQGVAQSQRGRALSIMATDGTQSSGSIVDVVVIHFSSLGVTRNDIDAVNYMLPTVMLNKAMSHATPSDHRLMLRLFDQLADWDDPSHLTQGCHMIWRMVRNPILCLMDQTLMAFVAYLLNAYGNFDAGRGLALQDKIREKQHAVLAGNRDLADRIGIEIHMAGRALFY